jgi:hypothetical protein
MIRFDCASSNDSASKRASSARLRQYFACPSINLLPRLRVPGILPELSPSTKLMASKRASPPVLARCGDRRDGYGADRLPQRARVCGLAWPNAAAADFELDDVQSAEDKLVAAHEASSRRRSAALALLGASLDGHFFQNGFAISPSTSAEKPRSLRWSCEYEASSSRER